jgi:PAS domain S-box-containing protein
MDQTDIATTVAWFARSDERLLLEHALMNAFLENVPDMVYFKDRGSRFLAVSKSKAARHGYSDPEQLIGKTDADLFAMDYARQTREEEKLVIATGVPLVDKVEKVVWPDGRCTWSRSSKLPLRSDKGDILGTFGISQDITAAREMEEALEKAHKGVIDASRLAGMAEVATGVLHNVGNVLNSLNVSATVIGSGVRQSKTESLAKVCDLLDAHKDDLGTFLTADPRGRLVPEFLRSLSQHTRDERSRLLLELDSLQKNIDHIKEIVTMQQTYATMVGVLEPLSPLMLVEDSLRMNASALVRHDVSVIRDFKPVPSVMAERGKVLQVLINLIRNAKYALDEGRPNDKVLTVKVEPGPHDTVRFVIQDNGVGIPPENLTRIFGHGFTTRTHGHGFGLHSSALAAKELHGSLTVSSAGRGQGAAFTLELPAANMATPGLPVEPHAAVA